MASGLLGQINADHDGVALYAAFLRADFDAVLRRATAFWAAHPDLTTSDAGRRLAKAEVDEDGEEDGDSVAWYFTVELVRSLGPNR